MSDGCTDALGLEVSGLGTGVAGATAGTSVGLGFAPVESGSSGGAQLAVGVGPGAAVLDFLAAPSELSWPPVCPPPDVPPTAAGVLPTVVRVPLPSVPAVGRAGALPPCSAVLAWRIALRNGDTPREMPAMTAIPASTVTSRSPAVPRPGKLLRRDRGLQKALGLGSESCQAQCPCQVQFRTRSMRPNRTLSGQGRGGRLPIRARILSSPSVPGSTLLTASDRARRSASSGSSSSGEVMPSPHLPAASLTPPAPGST